MGWPACFFGNPWIPCWQIPFVRGFCFPGTGLLIPLPNMSIKMGDTAVGVSVPVFGILSPDFGCSCEHHAICGTNTYLDMVVRFKTTIVEGGKCFLLRFVQFLFLLSLTLLSFPFRRSPRRHCHLWSILGDRWNG